MTARALARAELDREVERVLARTLRAIALRDRDDVATTALTARVAAADQAAVAGDTPMARLVARLGLAEAQRAFLWAAVAIATEPRLAVHAEALGGSPARRGLAVGLYVHLVDLAPAVGRDLALWLAGPNPLVASGLLTAVDDASPSARPGAAAPRLCAHLAGDDRPAPGLRSAGASAPLRYDAVQSEALAGLTAAFVAAPPPLIVIEGPRGTGRTTAVAHAAARPALILDGARADAAALIALRREAVLGVAQPMIADLDRLPSELSAGLGAYLDGFPGAIAVTTTMPGLDLASRRPIVRVRWPVPEPAVRRQLWASSAGAALADGELDTLALRYRIGPGAIVRAVASARTLADRPPTALELTAGLRHNIAEQLGGLAQRVEVTQRWDDLVLGDDTRDQVAALIARVRHAHRVLEQWGFRGKMARGTGVPALFSGPPGTGKTMVAGLIARELELELYQVDLSQNTSKWVGETEKQLARVFDAAEQGHALLLFDEADALFGQRSTDVKGAVDRYANLEVNYLLQRVESFGGITILTTNLDAGIDRALKRRLAAHIVFELPDEDERAALWRRMITTAAAPLAEDIDTAELARAFPKMSGANIRNAALAAAFFAAADRAPAIARDHLLRAARVEYRSMGHVLAERGRGR